ncbi:DUF937 domain-containing protein [Phragmitibacter flavus]|uniref:DUF937 domain-containing protein n=1 Tax=Phragmitibacter flavus TaxID=2576071 RepID=A0A5R8KIY6_9BACT|nr:YidB family protein [Phragmitibacter flavus]TLD71905.1 DUF937 domain-containing protein [Phragmitibacter flavus]
MSLFEDLGKKLLGGMLSGKEGGGGGDLISVVMQLLQDSGRMQGLLLRFQQAGFGAEVQSWIGNGSNLPLNGEQVQKALGAILPQLAQQTGFNEDLLAKGVAKLLPGLVNDLSPDGEHVEEGDLTGHLQKILGGGLGRLFS